MPDSLSERVSVRKSFRDFCVFDGWKNSADGKDKSFVGIKVENGCPKVYFPMGYADGESEIPCDAELRGDFFRLIALLSDKSLPGFFTKQDFEKCALDFPLHAFFGVLEYFRDFGYFVETENVYLPGFSGKISWAKTVKNERPQVVEDGDGNFRIAYIKPVVRKFRHRKDLLITLIHKFCVYEAARIVGPLCGVSENDVEIPEMLFDYGLFEEVLLEKMAATFNDRNLELFRNLLTVAKFLAKKRISGEECSENLFGVNTFAPVWEMMVDRIFGNLPQKSSRKDFNPHCAWNFDFGKSFENLNRAMRPDTILWDECGRRLFVLDAKFYKFGISGKPCDLPASESICKQVAYAEFAERRLGEKLELDGSRIYNAFVLPYCAKRENVDSKDLKMRAIGSCYGDWKPFESESGPSYHRIAGILLDVKSAMRRFEASSDVRKALSERIVEAVST